MKILQAPSNVANIGWAMAEGLRARGHHVEVWNHGDSPNDFPLDRVFHLDDAAGYARQLIEAVVADFDVFHFHGTRSLVPAKGPLPMMWDLPLLKALGKKLVFTFHGSDIRLKSKHVADPYSFYHFADIDCDEARIAQRLAVIGAYADHMTVGSVLNQVFVPGATYLPNPIDLARYRNIGLSDRTVPVVLHATRRRETKGTDMIISAVEALKSSGVEVDFRLVENVPYSQLMDAVADADIVIEKVLNGDAGVVSLEALAMGKIAVARINDAVSARHPDLPVVNANPETIGAVLKKLLTDAGLRRRIASQGRPYVEATHGPDVIAVSLEAIYRAPPKRHRKIAAWPQPEV